MKSVLVRPRKFTYTRRTFAKLDEHRYRMESIVQEVEETQVAHSIFVNFRQDSFAVQFFEITEEGRLAATFIVQDVVKIDDGVVVWSE